MTNKPDEYRIPQAQKLLDLYEEANSRPATTPEELIKWLSTAADKAAIAFDRVIPVTGT
jgi:hypothetical protein